MLKGLLEHSWRWRESNPRPSVLHQGFSGRSLLCFSQPRRSRKQVADGLSRCSMSRLVPRPGQAVIPLADARHRVEGIPGLTELYFALSGKSEFSARCVGTYCFAVTGLTRSQPQPSARFTWIIHRSRNRSPPIELSAGRRTRCPALPDRTSLTPNRQPRFPPSPRQLPAQRHPTSARSLGVERGPAPKGSKGNFASPRGAAKLPLPP